MSGQIPQGNLKFANTGTIYYSNGQGHCCGYDSWDNFVRLTGNKTTFATLPGQLSDYAVIYDGVCGGRPSHSEPMEQKIIELTNSERSKAGLQLLGYNSQLAAAAEIHSKGMANGDYFDHRNLTERVRQQGYQYSYIGENVSAVASTAEAIVQSWMNSPGHRANILNPEYKEIGVGYYYLANDTGQVNYHHYCTQIFGKR
jgi:uncharacterized protein YkwD